MADSCAKCGEALEPGDVKCTACGAELPPPVVPQANKQMIVVAVLLPLIALILIAGCIGGIAFAAVMYSRGQNRKTAPSNPPQPSMVTVPAVPQVDETKPVVTAPPPLPQPPIAATPAPEVNTASEPILTDFLPLIAAPGSNLILRGTGLAAVKKVLFISSHGASSASAIIIYQRDNQIIVAVPRVSTPDYGILIAVFSPGAVAILADQHTGATPWGTDGHLHDTVVSVHPGDEISMLDHMVVLAKSGSDISVGDNCIVFMHEDVNLHRYGKNCQIYFVGPKSHDGFTAIKALNVNFENDAFRVQPAPPGQDQ